MQKKLSDAKMKALSEEFADIVKSGGFEQTGPLPEEQEEELASLPRLVFRHRRRNFGRLRKLIDEINS